MLATYSMSRYKATNDGFSWLLFLLDVGFSLRQIKSEIFRYCIWTKDLRSGPPGVDWGAPTEKTAESAEYP